MNQAPLTVCKNIRNLCWMPTQCTEFSSNSGIPDIHYGVSYVDNILTYGCLRYIRSNKLETYQIEYKKLFYIDLEKPIKKVSWFLPNNGATYPLGVIAIDLEAEVVIYDVLPVLGLFFGEIGEEALLELDEIGVACDKEFGILGIFKYCEEILTCMVCDEVQSDKLVFGFDNDTCAFVNLTSFTEDKTTIDLYSDDVKIIQSKVGAVINIYWHIQAVKDGIIAVCGTEGISIINCANYIILIQIKNPNQNECFESMFWTESGNSIATVFKNNKGAIRIWDLRRKLPIREIEVVQNDHIASLARSQIDPRFIGFGTNNGKIIIMACSGTMLTPYAVFNAGYTIDYWNISRSSQLFHYEKDNQTFIFNIDSFIVQNSIKFIPRWINITNKIVNRLGGNLVCITEHNSKCYITTSRVDHDDPYIVEDFMQFFEYIDNKNLHKYCENKANESQIRDDLIGYELWTLLSIIIEDDIDLKNKILKYFNFTEANILSSVESIMSSNILDSNADSDYYINLLNNESNNENSTAFFDKLIDNYNTQNDELKEKEEINIKSITIKQDWDCPPLKYIRSALMMGKTELAINIAIQVKDFGTAFMLATQESDPSAYLKVKQKYIQSFGGNVPIILEILGEQDKSKLIEFTDIEQWKEVVVYILINYEQNRLKNYEPNTIKFTDLLTKIGHKLVNNGDIVSAIKCFIIGKNYDEALLWLPQIPSSSEFKHAFLILTIKAVASDCVIPPQAFELIYNLFIRLLNSGQLDQAKAMLQILGESPNTDQLISIIEQYDGHKQSFFGGIYKIMQSPQITNIESQSKGDNKDSTIQRGYNDNDNAYQQIGKDTINYNQSFQNKHHNNSRNNNPNYTANQNDYTNYMMKTKQNGFEYHNINYKAPLYQYGSGSSDSKAINYHYNQYQTQNMHNLPAGPLMLNMPHVSNLPHILSSTANSSIIGVPNLSPLANIPSIPNTTPIPNIPTMPTMQPNQSTQNLMNPPTMGNANIIPNNTNMSATNGLLNSNPTNGYGVPQPQSNVNNNLTRPHTLLNSTTLPKTQYNLNDGLERFNDISAPNISKMPSIHNLKNTPNIRNTGNMAYSNALKSNESVISKNINYSKYEQKWNMSTHPVASVGLLHPELPTPWPIPTEAQQKNYGSSHSIDTQYKTEIGEECSSELQNEIIFNFNYVVNQIKEPHKNTFKNLSNDISNGLQLRHFKKEAQEYLKQVAIAFKNEHYQSAQEFIQKLIEIAWNSNTKIIITALKNLHKIVTGKIKGQMIDTSKNTIPNIKESYDQGLFKPNLINESNQVSQYNNIMYKYGVNQNIPPNLIHTQNTNQQYGSKQIPKEYSMNRYNQTYPPPNNLNYSNSLPTPQYNTMPRHPIEYSNFPPSYNVSSTIPQPNLQQIGGYKSNIQNDYNVKRSTVNGQQQAHQPNKMYNFNQTIPNAMFNKD